MNKDLLSAFFDFFSIFPKIASYFRYSFVINALVVATFVSLCAALFGTTLVLRRFSFIGDGLAHSAFGALAIASILNFSNKMIFVLPVTIVFAILILCGEKKSKIKGDATIATISVSALAVGYILLNIFAPSANISSDVCGALFGSTLILTLSTFDVIFCVVILGFSLAFFVIFYNRIFALTFDEDFAFASGMKTKIFNIFLAAIIATIIVLSMNLVGSLLISALIVFPTISATRIFKSFKAVTICAAIFALILTPLGIIFSLVFETPVGATIICTELVALFAFCLAQKIKSR